MFHLAKTVRYAVNAKTKQHIFSASKIFARSSSVTTWNKDWQPGPYPRTEAERIAAAKKYNMIPEDYEPYPEEEGFGDYPKFIAYHHEDKDNFLVYDDDVLKRNYGEPVHPDIDICQEHYVNFQKKYKIPLWKMWLYVTLGATTYTIIFLIDQSYPVNQERIPKRYPYRGVPSYTFEPAD